MPTPALAWCVAQLLAAGVPNDEAGWREFTQAELNVDHRFDMTAWCTDEWPPICADVVQSRIRLVQHFPEPDRWLFVHLIEPDLFWTCSTKSGMRIWGFPRSAGPAISLREAETNPPPPTAPT